MTRDPETTTEADGFHRPHVNSALVVSAQSVAWTAAASTAAVALGIHSGTAVLVAFGAIGIVDAIGSVALVYHFHHGIRHEELSEELERLAHRVVLVGLLLVGCAAIVGGLLRLTMGQSSEPSAVGVALAAVSLVALVALSTRKQRIRAVSPATRCCPMATCLRLARRKLRSPSLVQRRRCGSLGIGPTQPRPPSSGASRRPSRSSHGGRSIDRRAESAQG